MCAVNICQLKYKLAHWTQYISRSNSNIFWHQKKRIRKMASIKLPTASVLRYYTSCLFLKILLYSSRKMRSRSNEHATIRRIAFVLQTSWKVPVPQAAWPWCGTDSDPGRDPGFGEEEPWPYWMLWLMYLNSWPTLVVWFWEVVKIWGCGVYHLEQTLKAKPALVSRLCCLYPGLSQCAAATDSYHWEWSLCTHRVRSVVRDGNISESISKDRPFLPWVALSTQVVVCLTGEKGY